MWHAFLDNLPVLVVIWTLYAMVCVLAARARRRTALPPCCHEREVIDRSTWATITFRCLDCGTTRTLGDVYFGASNHKSKGHAA